VLLRQCYDFPPVAEDDIFPSCCLTILYHILRTLYVGKKYYYAKLAHPPRTGLVGRERRGLERCWDSRLPQRLRDAILIRGIKWNQLVAGARLPATPRSVIGPDLHPVTGQMRASANEGDGSDMVPVPDPG
jgi:hypothetical protein